jgi:hypothetical protein
VAANKLVNQFCGHPGQRRRQSTPGAPSADRATSIAFRAIAVPPRGQPIYKRFAQMPGHATKYQKVFVSFFKKKRFLLFFFEKKEPKNFCLF